MRSLEWIAERGKNKAPSSQPTSQQPVQQPVQTQQSDASFDENVELSSEPPVS